ncbi:MAG: helix-turn-helix domain-containing protein [Defluviitaleaceae bacterium]|nr:helix-turn-helix domain-containing protein [Defluviitaleaceae bacterium]
MQNFVQSSLEYIEQNLKTDITADELAAMANYSVGHFCRLFAHAMDSTVASYILKRRLDHALAEISSCRKAIDVVHEYGFDTYAGFYKAFVKMYGCSPKKYLSIYKKSEVFIMLSEKDIQSILGNWDIPNGLKIVDASTRNWKTGKVEWQMWKIGDDYYLKTNERSIMVKNVKIAKALEKEGLASEFLPIPTTAGNDYVDGTQIFLLTKKVGEPLVAEPLSDEEIAALDYHDKRAESPYKLGQAIARLHRALKTVQDDVKPYEGNKYRSGLDAIPKVKEYLQGQGMTIDGTFFDDYTQTFGALYEKMPKQLIHGNPTGDTVVYEDGNIVGIKGYEIYNLSLVRLFDLIWCAGEINTRSIDEYLPMLKEILRGYDSLNSLTSEEKQAVYYMLCAAAMDCIAYVGDDTLDVLKRNLKALVFLADNKGMFSNLL